VAAPPPREARVPSRLAVAISVLSQAAGLPPSEATALDGGRHRRRVWPTTSGASPPTDAAPDPLGGAFPNRTTPTAGTGECPGESRPTDDSILGTTQSSERRLPRAASPGRPLPEPLPDLRPLRPGPRRPGGAARPAVTHTTVVGSARTAAPQVVISHRVAPSRVRSAMDAASSSPAVRPFTASSRPPGLTSGRHHPASTGRGATARAIAASTLTAPRTSSARARNTVTLPSPRSAITSSSQFTRRCSGSINVTETSGRAIAIATPGRPAPDPTSTVVAPSPNNCATEAQLSRCRCHNLGISRGPISPLVTALDDRCRWNCRARSAC
jgi:hypothetical protein